MTSKKILVHCCCGPCSTASIERLLSEGWDPVLFYTNSNIWPAEEFEKRWENLEIVASHYGLEVMREEQDHAAWLERVKGHEDDHEGGERCSLCFRYNLERAYRKAVELNIEHFCTTLTISRFKNSRKVFAAGEDLVGFETIDFKKKDGFNRSCVLARELGLYRQQYCGCEFSIRDAVPDE
ncbi:MAG: epoxyqueuosine reductase QueH [Spirochaetales bacterium]|nr:epoxyqueuosine reductase QueH [Spirochaetales bacterium]